MEQQKPNFIKENRNPKLLSPDNLPASLINAVSIAMEISWKDAFQLLYKQAHNLCLMPDNMKCSQDTLRECGFFQQSVSGESRSVNDIVNECNENFSDGEVVIVCIPHYGKGGHFIAIVPEFYSGEKFYVHKDYEDFGEHTVKQIWIRWRDGQEHSIKKRRKFSQAGYTGKKSDYSVEDKDGLHILNANPAENNTGDCVVRAIAGVLDTDWHKALDMLAEASEYACPVINIEGVYDMLLMKEGFEKHKPLLKNGRYMKGVDFCHQIKDMYPNGTKIFAYSGSHHVVAILIYDSEYKIIDSWDSSESPIGEFWTKYPERTKKEKSSSEKVVCAVGNKIKHSVYGTGVIEKISQGIVNVNFEKERTKRLGESWIIKNCIAIK